MAVDLEARERRHGVHGSERVLGESEPMYRLLFATLLRPESFS